ncbi:MAG TPA: YbaK/EbsC family protein [Hyphomicrobium sp.]|nr:YbaK/EbsC family protein [Hyphomicrobium sp.]HRQ25583.1 YbaK/EbsC family protein [Hyphomicrobium sp.]
MGIARTVQTFLANRGVSYDVLTHQPTSHALATARACDVSRDTLAKGILIRRKDGYLLAVLPASRKVRLADLAAWLNELVALATEAEVTQVFADANRAPSRRWRAHTDFRALSTTASKVSITSISKQAITARCCMSPAGVFTGSRSTCLTFPSAHPFIERRRNRIATGPGMCLQQ